MKLRGSGMNGVWIVVLGLVAAVTAAGSAATLVEDGRPASTIVVDAEAPEATREAAAMLADYLQRISGVEVAVVASPAEVETPVTVWVGWHSDLPARLPAVGDKPSRDTEIVIASQGNDVAILGRDLVVDGTTVDAGTRNAMYVFLERELGVRWLWPGELGEDVPQRDTVTVAEGVHRYVPPLQWRQFRIANYADGLAFYPGDRAALQEPMEAMDAKARLWLQRQHGGGPVRMAAGHAYSRWYDEYGQTHPDYFALQPDGTRTPYPNAKNVKLCVSNPAVVEQWVDNAVELLERYPARRTISAAINDSGYSGFCTCPDCEALDPAEGPTFTLKWDGIEKEHVALTDRCAVYWNRLARRLAERMPGREFYITVLAYGATTPPPVSVELDERIIVGFVGSIPYADEQSRQEDRALWAAWAEKAPHLYWRPNMYHYLWGMPGIFTRRAAEDFAFLADHHMAGIDIDTVFNNWATQGLQYYLMVKLAWDPHLDVAALVDDYLRRAFGEAAAPHMARYFDTMERAHGQWAERTVGLHRYQAIGEFPGVFTEAWLAELKGFLDQAKAAAAASGAASGGESGGATDTQRRRLAFMTTGFEFMQAQAATITAMSDLRYGNGDLVALAKRAVAASQRRDALLDEQIGSFAISAMMYHTGVGRRHMQPYLGPPEQSYIDLAQNAADDRSVMLPMTWQFRLDPADQGTAQRWYEAQTAEALEWQPIRVTGWWDDQLLSDDPVDPVAHGYRGVAWYRVRFDADPVAGQTAWLRFGAVDEGCWVYLNGVPVGEQPFDPELDGQSWQKPRRFDVTQTLRPGSNELVVRVESHVGKGGIYKPVTLEYAPANLVPNGGFEAEMTGWRVGVGDDLVQAVEFGFDHGQFVGERSLRVHVDQDTGGHAGVTALVDTPLAPGQYAVRVRYREELEGPLGPKEAGLRVRVTGVPEAGETEGRDRLWLHSTSGDGSWANLSELMEVPEGRAYSKATVRVFFYKPGTYWVDEIALHRMEPAAP